MEELDEVEALEDMEGIDEIEELEMEVPNASMTSNASIRTLFLSTSCVKSHKSQVTGHKSEIN